jgi:hypothetical protein
MTTSGEKGETAACTASGGGDAAHVARGGGEVPVWMWGGVLLGKDRRRRRWISGAWDGEKNGGDGDGAGDEGEQRIEQRWIRTGGGGGAKAETEGRMAVVRKKGEAQGTASAARPCRHIQRVVVPDAGCSSPRRAPPCRAWMGRRRSWREGGEASEMGSGGGRRRVGLSEKTVGAAGEKRVGVDAGRASGGGVHGEGRDAREGGRAGAEGGRESAPRKKVDQVFVSTSYFLGVEI